VEIRERLQSELLTIDTGGKRPYEVDVSYQELPIRGLPDELCGAHMVHLTDFHAGYGNTDPVFEEAIRRLDVLKPEFVFLTGDYLDDRSARKGYRFGDILERIQARHGVYASLGNHDHRAGPKRISAMLEQYGVRVLNNESVCVGPGLWVAGVDDLLEGKPDVDVALREIPSDQTPIVLAHNPSTIRLVGDRSLVMLSGHTHGGQIVVPFPSPRLVVWVHLRCRHVSGWYTQGNARLYVNRGIGVTGKPFRFRCPAEIAVFRLTRDCASPAPADERSMGSLASGTAAGR